MATSSKALLPSNLMDKCTRQPFSVAMQPSSRRFARRRSRPLHPHIKAMPVYSAPRHPSTAQTDASLPMMDKPTASTYKEHCTTCTVDADVGAAEMCCTNSNPATSRVSELLSANEGDRAEARAAAAPGSARVAHTPPHSSTRASIDRSPAQPELRAATLRGPPLVSDTLTCEDEERRSDEDEVLYAALPFASPAPRAPLAREVRHSLLCRYSPYEEDIGAGAMVEVDGGRLEVVCQRGRSPLCVCAASCGVRRADTVTSAEDVRVSPWKRRRLEESVDSRKPFTARPVNGVHTIRRDLPFRSAVLHSQRSTQQPPLSRLGTHASSCGDKNKGVRTPEDSPDTREYDDVDAALAYTSSSENSESESADRRSDKWAVKRPLSGTHWRSSCARRHLSPPFPLREFKLQANYIGARNNVDASERSVARMVQTLWSPSLSLSAALPFLRRDVKYASASISASPSAPTKADRLHRQREIDVLLEYAHLCAPQRQAAPHAKRRERTGDTATAELDRPWAEVMRASFAFYAAHTD
ncbi:hypothetical protein ABL78_0251 [Leptomonas seymouri]|uniref:Uncharacterized protein n=1 Tax=Leptomonas seymouri TaxID=5684 RepID=A0A0N1IMT9_LEPSE|nr:hypothetical protein ABL78_0251 [Leptomonas seymouri]|eukprot:KPI90655.1 hypothetical protein ABL78_0251 [Leptomonas seymouri]